MSYVSPIKIGYEAELEEGWTDKIGKYIAGEVDNLVLESCVKVGCHVDQDELEKALRYDRGQYEKGYEDGKRDAAAAIEELQAENKELRGRIEDEELKIDFLTADNTNYEIAIEELKAQLPKRCEWIVFNKQMLINLENAREQYKELGYPHRTELGLQCSNCRKVTYVDSGIKYEFCPHCGAKMET